MRTGLGLDAEINLVSVFDRKNYFYADLPAGYQISPVQPPDRRQGRDRRSTCRTARAATIGITRLHLEQDAGKSLHDQHPTLTYVDLNRAGVALMEIVSEPDMRSAEEAGAYLRKLRSILRYLGTCDGNMEEGSLRCDVNVSVRKPGRAAGHALRDQERQLDPLRHAGDRARGAPPDRAASRKAARSSRRRGCSMPARGETRSMRSKEQAHDYRYFPDPDLLPLVLDAGLGRGLQGGAARAAGREEGALHRRLQAVALRCRRAGGRAGDRRLLRDGGQGPRPQAGRQLGDGRALRRAEPAGPRHRAVAGLGRGAGRALDGARVIVKDSLACNFFGTRLEMATDAEQRYLSAMASLGQGSIPGVGRRPGVRADDQRKVSMHRESLIQKGLIWSPRRGQVDFTVPLFAEFLRTPTASLSRDHGSKRRAMHRVACPSDETIASLKTRTQEHT